MIRRIESRQEKLTPAHRYVLVAEWGTAFHVPSDAFLRLPSQWGLSVTVISVNLAGYELEVTFEPTREVSAGTMLDRFGALTQAGMPGIETTPAARRLFAVDDSYVSVLDPTGGETIARGARAVGRGLTFGLGAIGAALVAVALIVVLK